MALMGRCKYLQRKQGTGTNSGNMYYLQVNQQEGLMELLPCHCQDTTDCYEQNGTITHGSRKVNNMGNYRPVKRGKKYTIKEIARQPKSTWNIPSTTACVEIKIHQTSDSIVAGTYWIVQIPLSFLDDSLPILLTWKTNPPSWPKGKLLIHLHSHPNITTTTKSVIQVYP